MADYKISIGAELRTKDIDAEVKKYKGNVEVGSTLDTSGITKILNAYKPSPLNVNTKLSTTGITKALQKYKAKNISVKIDPDFNGIDRKIEAHTIDTSLRVKVDINWAGVKGQIASPTEDLGKLQLDAELNDEAIGKAIKGYKPTSSIKVDVDPDFSEAGKKISGYQMRNMLKVNVKLNKTAIDSQIKNFQTSKHIEVGAKLKDNAIESAITKYTAKELVPITIDFKVGDNKEVSQKISEYKNTPVDIPVKLTPAKTGFSDKITNTPVKVSATVDHDDIRKNIEVAVGGYTPSAKMPVNIKLTMPKDINSQVKGLGKPTEPIDVNVRLDGSNINADIALFKPTATLGVKPDLIFENIEEEIRAYIPKEKVRVHLDLIDSDINAEAGKQNTKAPITVNVKLDPDSINKQIEDLKPSAKVNVGVQLDFASHKGGQKGIPQQIKDYKTKSKIKVGVELDEDSVVKEVNNIKVNTPIKLGVELDPDGIKNVKNQIDGLRQQIQQLGNVNVNLGGNRVGNGGVGSVGGQDIQTVRIARGVDDVTRAYRQLLSIQNRMSSKQQAVAKLDTSKNAHEILELSNQIDELARKYQRIHQLFSGQFSSVQVDTLNRNFEITAEKLNVIKQKALDAKESLDRMSNSDGSSTTNGASGSARKQVDETTQAYKELLGVLNELNSKRLQLNGLDASSPQSSEKIQKLRLQIEQLDNEYNNLLRSFNAQGIQFTADQWNQLETIMAKVGRRIDVVQAGMSDKSAIQSQTQAYKELLSISKEISSLEINIEKLKLQGGSSSQIEVLENQLRTLQSTYQQIVTTMNTPLTNDQWSSIYTQVAKMSEELEKLRAKHADARAELAKDVKTDIGTGKLQKAVNDVKESFKLLRIEDQGVQGDIERLQSLLGNMDSRDDVESVINDYQEFSQLLDTVKNKVKELQREQSNSGEMLDLKKESAMMKLVNLFEDGSQAADHFGKRAKQLANELNACGNANIDNVTRKIANLGEEVKKSGLQTKTFTTRLKEQFSRYSQYLSIASVFMYVGQAMRSMFEQVKLIDSAMTELKKVTDETDESYNQFLSNAASRAKELGTTIDGLVSSTADFARLGYGFEDSQKLAEVANIYAVVGDEIEGVEGATESLISTLAAFRDETSGISDADFAMDIIDIFNELGNKFAISSGGLGEALERSASSLQAANNTIHESAALITAANEVVVLCHAA